MTANSLNQRKPVWLALSEFYLDTELEELDIQRIATVLREGGITYTQTQKINAQEVAPVIIANTWAVAGEWAGLDEKWLFSEILRRIEGGPPTLFFSKRLWHYWVEWHMESHLERLKPYMPE